MASIYKYADENIFKTWFLITFFFVFVIAIGWLFSYSYGNDFILIFAVLISFIMSITSYWYSDKIVLSMAKAKLIEKKDNPELYRLVENLAITAGLPLPKIYIINESQPNAFATGRNKDHAVIAVTRGLLEKLDKTELEGRCHIHPLCPIQYLARRESPVHQHHGRGQHRASRECRAEHRSADKSPIRIARRHHLDAMGRFQGIARHLWHCATRQCDHRKLGQHHALRHRTDL